jgi:hypothetical protein
MAASASAGEDPLAGGVTKLKLDLPKGVTMEAIGTAQKHGRTIRLPITEGNFDPVAGSGSETFTGAGLLLKFRGNLARVTQLVASYGAGGALSGKVDGSNKTVAKIKGGTVGRNGFGGAVADATVKLTNAGAKALNNGLATDKRKPMRAGEIGVASTKTDPATVEVVGGTANLAVNPTAVGKLGAKGVNPATGGVTPIAPATLTPATLTFSFPVTGGSLAIDGTAGAVNADGGATLKKTSATGNAGCDAAHPVGTFVSFGKVVSDYTAKVIRVDATLPPPLSVVPNTPLADTAVTGAISDATAKTITVTSSAAVSTAAALSLNSLFGTTAEGCGPAGTDAAAGDALGTLTMSVTTH